MAVWNQRSRAGALAFLMIGLLALAGCSLPWNTPPPISATCRNAATAANPIAAENTCPGSSAWRRSDSAGKNGAIDGYTVPASVAAGRPVQLYVTTTASSYTYAIYRMGYYQGLGGRLIYQSPSITGHQQPAPAIDPITHMVECVWHDPVTIQTQASWVSGMYLIQLISSDGNERYDYFVVRDASPHAPILYSLPFTTYQAYNLWGGYSLYYHLHDDGTYTNDRAQVVSFDRPFYLQGGLGLFGLYDLPLLSWMESQSYNMSYVADFDLDAPTIPLRPFKLIISSGHAEYWSAGMRASVTRARDAGVSLAFFAGNQMYWQVRLGSSPLGPRREVTCYKSSTDDPITATQPKLTTTQWRASPVNEPESSVLGQQYAGILLKPTALQLASGSAPFLAGTSLTPSSSFPNLVAGEYDQVVPGQQPAHLQIIASTPVLRNSSADPHGIPDTTNTTLYTAASGAKVFDAGTFGWAWGLSDLVIAGKSYPNTNFQKLTANILAALLRS